MANHADSLVLATGRMTARPPVTVARAIRAVGSPDRICHFRQYRIVVWDGNVLLWLPSPYNL